LIKKTSFELIMSKHGNNIDCTLTRSPCQSMMVPKFSLPLNPQSSLRTIMASFNNATAIASKEKTTSEKFAEALFDIGFNVGLVLEPILKHFNLVERKGDARLNLTIRPDKHTVKIPWELAILTDEPDQLLCQRMNIGRTMEVENKEGFQDRLNAKTGSNEYNALIVGIDYKNCKPKSRLHFAQTDAKLVRRNLERFGKKNNLNVLPPLIGGNAKKEIIKNRFAEGITTFHFSGHGNLDTRVGEISLCKGKLSAKEVDKVLTESGKGAPALSFMNACETCLQKPDRWGVYDWARVMANNGGRSLIGTFWSVQDKDATDFSITFYRNFFQRGKTIGESVRIARENVLAKGEDSIFTWPAFVLYGPPNLRANDIIV